VFEDHDCVEGRVGASWHDNLFSVWGLAIAAVLVYGVVEIVTKEWLR